VPLACAALLAASCEPAVPPGEGGLAPRERGACRDRTEATASPAPGARRAHGRTGALTLLTYNVLGDRSLAEARGPALLEIIRESDADIVALQEVRRWFLARLLAEPWFAERYRGTTHEGGHMVARGLYVMSSFPIERTVTELLPGAQLRMALVVTIRVNNRTLALADVHLESPLDAGPVRARQLERVFPLVENADDAVVLGDFNFGEGEEPESSGLDPRYEDAWRALRAGQPGHTWDVGRNPMARRNSFPGEKSRRLDRVLVRSSVWRPVGARILGDRPVAPGNTGVFPSDHFGLAVRLEAKATESRER
jgi:endonuclease/exonuclease/phosphatase family metal-dependent hydrolase